VTAVSELNWQQVNQLPVDAVKSAADYWTTYRGKVVESAEAVGSDVAKTIGDEHFGGDVADASRGQLQKIATEFEQHVDEFAKPLAVLLEDAHEVLSRDKQAMNAAVERVLDAQLAIKPDGEVYLTDTVLGNIVRWAQANAERAGKPWQTLAETEIARWQQQACDPMTAQVKGIVEAARAHDDDITTKLNALRDKHVDMPPPVGSDENKDVAEYWASKAVDLLNGGADGKMSPAELDEFNKLVEERSGQPEFSTALMNKLGPDGLVEHLDKVSNDVFGDDKSTYSKEQLSAMHESLGKTLATATDPTKQPHVDERWTAEFMNRGATGDNSNAPNGYQTVAPLLKHGKYHEDFLTPVAEHMMAIDKQGPWPDGSELDNLGGPKHPNANPLNYALEAVDHNPKAAQNLFTGNGKGMEDIEGVDLSGTPAVEDPVKYLMDRAEDSKAGGNLFTGGTDGDRRDPLDPNLVGNALESAATGVSTDPDYKDRPVVDSNAGKVADKVIDYATENRHKFTKEPMNDMMDNFGNITAAYMDDFHRSIASPTTQGWAVDRGPSLDLGSDATQAGKWLKLMGSDEIASATVQAASERLMYDQIQTARTTTDLEPGTAYNEAFEMHGNVTAAVTDGTLDAIADGVHQQAEDHNDVVDAVKKVVEGGAGVAFGYATGPWGGEAAGQVTSAIADRVGKQFEITEAEAARTVADKTTTAYQKALADYSSPNASIERLLANERSMNDITKSTTLENFTQRFNDSIQWVVRGYTDTAEEEEAEEKEGS
jgi:hypothetical protein